MQNLTADVVAGRIYALPGRPPFMLVYDLAEFYETTPKRIMEQVRRHPDRFPADFIFELSKAEKDSLVAQNARSKSNLMPQNAASNKVNHGALFGFTEEGAYAVSGILTGPVADRVSVFIIRAFVAMSRRLLAEARFFRLKAQSEATRLTRYRLIVDGVRDGLSLHQIWLLGNKNTSKPTLALAARECLANGWTSRLPDGMPAHQPDLFELEG